MNHPETQLHLACVRFFRLKYPKYAMLLHHSPNEGNRVIKVNKYGKPYCPEGKRNKDMSVIPGFADLFLVIAKGQYHGLFIELKVDNCKLSDSQKLFRSEVLDQGYAYVIVRSIEEFIDVINKYLNSQM